MFKNRDIKQKEKLPPTFVLLSTLDFVLNVIDFFDNTHLDVLAIRLEQRRKERLYLAKRSGLSTVLPASNSHEGKFINNPIL